MKTEILGKLEEALVILDDLTDEIAYQPMVKSITNAMGKITVAKHAIKEQTKKEVKLKRTEAAFIKRMLDHWIESADTRYLFAKTAEQGNEFESLICEDSQGRAFVIGLNIANYNYKRYKVGDIFTIKSARCYSVSPTLSFLYYVRIKH